MRVNFDYLNIFKEPVLFAAFIARHTCKRKQPTASDAILIVNTGLVGEFAASVPAMHEVIRQSKGAPVDLLVAPPLKALAGHLVGVRDVYCAQSVFARANEKVSEREKVCATYAKIVVLRMSSDAYQMLNAIKTACIETGFPQFVSYGIGLGWNILCRKTPRSWREVNFAMVGATPRPFPFTELFTFLPTDYERVRALPALRTAEKKIIIHTGASWVMNHWSSDNWVELLKKIHAHGDFRFIFVGAKKDEEDYHKISAQLPFPTYSLIGAVDLVDLLLVLNESDYLVGVDSGPRNLAHLVDLPSIILLGPGPHLYTPPNPRDIVLDHSRGRGLYQRFFRKKKNRFIDRITPHEVYEAFLQLSKISESPSTLSSPND